MRDALGLAPKSIAHKVRSYSCLAFRGFQDARARPGASCGASAAMPCPGYASTTTCRVAASGSPRASRANTVISRGCTING